MSERISKILVDNNLSVRLPEVLASDFPGSVHVATLELTQATDTQLWELARTRALCYHDQRQGFLLPSQCLWIAPVGYLDHARQLFKPGTDCVGEAIYSNDRFVHSLLAGFTCYFLRRVCNWHTILSSTLCIIIKGMFKTEETAKNQSLTPARAMLLTMLYRYRALGEEASEFAAEELSYFLQRFGETQLKLNFKQSHYGPYSGKVRHVLYALNGFYLKGFEQKQAQPVEPLELVVAQKSRVDAHVNQHLGTVEKGAASASRRVYQWV